MAQDVISQYAMNTLIINNSEYPSTSFAITFEEEDSFQFLCFFILNFVQHQLKKL